MKNTPFLTLLLLFHLNIALAAEQQNQQRNSQIVESPPASSNEESRMIQNEALFDASVDAQMITADETTKTSKAYRYHGFIDKVLNSFNSPLNLFNQLATYYNFNNMERLEYLKYWLDMGHIPLPPYIDLPNYFEVAYNSNETFPQIEDIINLRDVCDLASWYCDPSPVSFVRLAFFTKAFSREFDQRVITYADLLNLSTTLGYTSEDLTLNDLIALGQLARNLNYIPLWPHLLTQKRYIRNVTDDNFQEEVLDASTNGQPIIVYFYASWCTPCHTMGLMMEDLAIEFEGAFTLAKVYFDGNSEARKTLSRDSISALLFYKDGRVVLEDFGFSVPPENTLSSLEVAQQALRNLINRYIRRYYE